MAMEALSESLSSIYTKFCQANGDTTLTLLHIVCEVILNAFRFYRLGNLTDPNMS